MNSEKIKILIADDHPLFKAGVKQTLLQKKNYEIFEAEDGNEALNMIKKLEPEIAIIDLQMPGKTGLEILENLFELPNSTKVILLTMHKNVNYFYQAVSLGVKGYLLKETAVDELLIAVNLVSNGKVFISKRLEKQIEAEKKDRSETKLLIEAINSLTKTEKEIMKLVADWKSNHEIANLLFNSVRTIENHRANITDKLNLHGTHSLIKFAIENKELF